MGKTAIQWTEATWNPVRGCSRVSAGCQHCYAEQQAHRFSGKGQPYEGLTRLTQHGPVWTGKVRLVPEALSQPDHWKKPRRVFVNSMSDVFHEDVPDEFIDQIFATMANTWWHTYQILTKRPERMLDYMQHLDKRRIAAVLYAQAREEHPEIPETMEQWDIDHIVAHWPLPNVWLGVSVENQDAANERIPLLLQTPATVRFLSCEPLLGSVDLNNIEVEGPHSDLRQWTKHEALIGRRLMSNEGNNYRVVDTQVPKVDWVIVGGESGPGARPCDLAWVQSIVEQCKAAHVACFVKQLGARPIRIIPAQSGFKRDQIFRHSFADKKGGDMEEWATELQVREYPPVEEHPWQRS